jgi:hypothetical protein
LIVKPHKGVPFEWTEDCPVHPVESKLPVIIACDQSKRGYAVKVGDISGKQLKLFEMSGEGMTTEKFCEEFAEYFRLLFRNVEIDYVAYEAMILKKGMQYYSSSETLHDIRVATKNVFKELTGTYPDEINNQEWKTSVLPKGFRGRDEKGSQRFLKSLNYQEWYDASDNITDVWCIFEHVKVLRHTRQAVKCTGVEPVMYKTEIYIVSVSDSLLTRQYNSFHYNPEFSVEDNANYFVNRIPVLGVAEVPVQVLTLQEIYNYARGFVSIPTRAFLTVRRDA